MDKAEISKGVGTILGDPRMRYHGREIFFVWSWVPIASRWPPCIVPRTARSSGSDSLEGGEPRVIQSPIWELESVSLAMGGSSSWGVQSRTTDFRFGVARIPLSGALICGPVKMELARSMATGIWFVLGAYSLGSPPPQVTAHSLSHIFYWLTVSGNQI